MAAVPGGLAWLCGVLGDHDVVAELDRGQDVADPVLGELLDSLKAFGLVEMVLFIVTVLVAYAYVWRRGGLEWD